MLSCRRQLVVGKFNIIVLCPRVDKVLALKLFERRAPILGDRRDLLRPSQKTHFDDAAVARFYDAAAAKGARVAKGDWFGEEARVFSSVSAFSL